MPNGRSQDIEFVIQEKPHEIFTRDGNDLKATLKITLTEALCGFNKPMTMLDGSSFNVTNGDPSRSTQPNSVLYFKGKGMPISKQPGTYGDLYVTINVNLPTFVTDDQKFQLKKLFP